MFIDCTEKYVYRKIRDLSEGLFYQGFWNNTVNVFSQFIIKYFTSVLYRINEKLVQIRDHKCHIRAFAISKIFVEKKTGPS